MGLATISHVETYVPGRGLIATSTVPSASQVIQIIEDATLDIDMALVQAGYALPIPTGATIALGFLQQTCAKCAAAAVEKVAPTHGKGQREGAQAMCTEAMKMIASGELPGLDRDDAQSRPRANPGASPYFTRDMQL